MAKKTKKEDVVPEANIETGAPKEKQENLNEQASKKSGSVVTTEGNTLDKFRIYQKDGATMVQAEYGKLSPGKTAEERRANMHLLAPRVLSPVQAEEYQRLYAADPVAAKAYVAREAFPMHVDDAAFHNATATINGRAVNYINIEKISETTFLLNALRRSGVAVDTMDKSGRDAAIAAMSPEARAEALKGNEGLVGRWQISFGVKGDKASRFFGILNKEEISAVRHRGEVNFDDKGRVTSVGKPLSLADIASRAEQRIVDKRQTAEASLAAAQKVNWGRFKLPEGANITGLHYVVSKEQPDRVVLRGKVNGIDVSGVLATNEAVAVRNKVASLDQVAAANRDFMSKVKSILSSSQTVGKEAAVGVIIARTSDPAAKAFTPEQVGTINAFAAGAATPEERQKVFDGLWAEAQPKLAAANINEVWQKDVQVELSELAKGVVREEQQGLKR